MSKAIVFYVDDERPNLDSFSLGAPDEWDVHTFLSGPEAIAALGQTRPSLLITDVLMEGIGGVELVFAIKIVKDINLVCVSGISKEEVSKRCGDLGDTLFFTKPLEADFFKKVEHLATPEKPFSINLSAVMLDYLKEYESMFAEYWKWQKVNTEQQMPEYYVQQFKKYQETLGLLPADNEKLWQSWKKK